MADSEKARDNKTTSNVPDGSALGWDVGYIGTKVDPRPNEEHSLESGPDSPSAADVAVDVAAQRTEALEAAA
jgi:hypothetical protein